MTSVLNVDTIADKAGTGPVGLTKQHAAKAWANANNDATLDDSFNISGGADNGTGDYTYSFVNSATNANFAIASICIDNNAEICHNSSRATGSFGVRVKEGSDGTSARDRPQSAIMHGDLT